MSRSHGRLICVVIFLALAPIAIATDFTQGGYADRTSVAQGGTITFRIASSIAPFALQIVNLAHPAQVLSTIVSLTSPPSDCAGLWENGCGWPNTAQFTIPSNWPSGYYAARFPTGLGTRQIVFVVRAANPGLASSIVVVSPTNTWQAYNQFGGKSVYDSLSTNGQRAHVVSFLRPYLDNSGLGRYPDWEQTFVDWMTAENRPFEVITDDDLADPSILSAYRVVVMAGHAEYWTLEARQTVEAFAHAGHNVAVFGGNSMWWQARVNLAAHQLTVYKDATLDPLHGVDDPRVTVNWYDDPVYHPENFIFGSSFRNGGYTNIEAGEFDPLPDDERSPYTVIDASSWLLAGTALTNGQTFGRASAGIEVDGAIFNTLPSGELVAEGSDGTPPNFRIVATVPASLGYGVIGLYTNDAGGTVVNMGTRDWLSGLASDAAVQQITRNVLDRLSASDPLPYEARMNPWRAEDLFNTPSPMAGVLPGWRGDMLQAALSAQCAQEGPLGLRMKGTDWTQFLRNFAPDHVGVANAWVSFELNADLLTGTPDFPMPVVELVDEQTDAVHYNVAVELQMLPQGKSIRLSLFHPNGSSSGSTPWQVLPSGWQRAVMTWRSPGLASLQVGNGTRMELNNPESGQTVNELMLEFAGSAFGATGSLCLDALRLRDSIAAGVTTTSLTSSLNPSNPGDEVTLTANVSRSPGTPTITGSVTFRDGTTVLGTVTLAAGTASISRSNLGPGTHSITATYSGDEYFDTSTSATLTQAVTLLPPSSVDAFASTTTEVTIAWSPVANAASYRVERSGDGALYAPIATVAAPRVTIQDTSVNVNASYLYRVIVIDSAGNAGLPSTSDVATTVQFASDPNRVIRTAHINELRVAIDILRNTIGLAPATYTRTIRSGLRVQASDLAEMRAALNAARAEAGLPAFAYAEGINAGTTIRWSHWRELQLALGGVAAGP
jgi:Bacterial Ig-like domain (group 3)